MGFLGEPGKARTLTGSLRTLGHGTPCGNTGLGRLHPCSKSGRPPFLFISIVRALDNLGVNPALIAAFSTVL